MRWMVYFDASALAKRYSPESGTPLVNEIFRLGPTRSIACFSIGVAEVFSILVRKKNDGRIDREYYDQAISDLTAEVIENDEILISSVDDGLAFASLRLIAKHHINAVDAMILEDLIGLERILEEEEKKLLFVTSDKRLVRAARSEGIEVLNPEVANQSQVRETLGGI